MRRLLLAIIVVVAGCAVLRCATGAARDRRAGSAERPDPVLAPEAGDAGEPARSSVGPEREEVGVRPRNDAPGSAGERLFITGLVTERSGAPLESARCLLRRSVPASGFLVRASTEEPVAASTLSDRDGSFRLEAGPGFWEVSVHAPGFARWEHDHLVAGDALLVRLDPEVQLSVSVVGPAEEPVEDADVIVRAADEVAPEHWRCRLRTDAGGRAWTADVAPGAWYLTVRHPGYGVAGASLEIPVGRFRIEKEIRLQRGTRVAGSVRTRGGAPIPGARIRIESPYREVFLVEETTTGADGRYSTAAIFSLPETLEVLAQAAGHAESSTLIGIRPEQAMAGMAVVDFVLPESARTLAGRVVSAPGEAVRGASVRIAALDPVGATPEEVIVALRAAPPAPWLWQEAARTDEAGRFELSGLSDSPQYVLLVMREGFAPRMVWAPPAEAGSVTRLEDVELLAWGSLFGRARYADGSPAEGAMLVVQRLDRVMVAPGGDLALWRPQSWFLPLETRTREGGFFRFDTLAPGTYALLQGDPSWEVGAGRAVGPVEVVLPDDERAGARIEVTGSVVDRAGLPIPMVFVQAYTVDDSGAAHLESSDLVDAGGAFSLRAPSDRPVRLFFRDLRAEHVDRELLHPANDRTPLEVVLDERADPPLPLEGLVLGPRGEPIEGCDLRLHPPEDGLCDCITFHAKTDATGAFRFERVSEGLHRIVVSDPRFLSATYYPARAGDHVVIRLEER